MKLLTRCTAVLSISLLLVLPKKLAQGCGFSVWPGEYRFWLLQPDLTNQKELSPFFFATTYLYPGAYMQVVNQHYSDNVREWQALVKNKATAADIDSILYNTAPDDFLDGFNGLAKTNSFAACLQLPQHTAFLQYMRLSKKIEGLTASPDPWGEGKYPNPAFGRLIEEAHQLYATTTDSTVRLRTAYQLMKLYGHNRQWALLKRTYHTKIARVKSNSWIKAAALYELALHTPEPECSYLYSRVFDLGTYNRSQCLIDFNPKSLQNALPFTANEQEVTVLYAMRAFNDPGKTLRNIRFIYSREPRYKELPFLLLREINKVEDWLMTPKMTDFGPALYDYHFMDDVDLKANYKKDTAYARELHDFVKTVIAERKHKEQPLLHMYAAHLAFVRGCYGEARRYLHLAARIPGLPANVKTQLQVNEVLLRLATEPSFDATTEHQLMRLLLMPSNKLGVHDPDIMKDQLILYAGQHLIGKGEKAKGLLLLGKTRRALGELSIDTYKSVYEAMWETATADDYDSILYILNKKRPSAFERFVAKGRLRSAWDYQDWTEPDTAGWNRHKLIDLKAGWYIRQDSLEQALAVLKQLPEAYWKKYPYDSYGEGDPLYVNIYHSRKAEVGEKSLSKPQVIGQMIQLKKKITAGPQQAALHYFKLANAYYNLSYHGKQWLLSKPWRSMYDLSPYRRPVTISAFNDNYYGCARARQYYLAALQATSNRKLASLCCMMAGKCAENYREYLEATGKKTTAGRFNNPYTGLLKQKGMNTAYYKELIEECATYNHFIQQVNKY